MTLGEWPREASALCIVLILVSCTTLFLCAVVDGMEVWSCALPLGVPEVMREIFAYQWESSSDQATLSFWKKTESVFTEAEEHSCTRLLLAGWWKPSETPSIPCSSDYKSQISPLKSPLSNSVLFLWHSSDHCQPSGIAGTKPVPFLSLVSGSTELEELPCAIWTT